MAKVEGQSSKPHIQQTPVDKFLSLSVVNRKARDDWEPGEICYYWQLGQLHTAVFCRWTVGNHQWAAVFDIQPSARSLNSDGYDYATTRVRGEDLFDDRNVLIELVTAAFRAQITNYTVGEGI